MRRFRAAAAFALGLATVSFSFPASALSIEITGGGADRLERQRAWSEGELPLAGTPDLSKLQERLAAAGLREGAAIFVRIFKSESELELWMQKGRELVLFATYPICQWSGILGPKLYEGDNQSPEGFYTVGRRDLKWQTRHHRAFNVGFPNAFDRMQGRTGSNILVHGGCSTEGCFAMTNPVIDEIFRLANAAVASGQREFQVHVFPFRMTAENLLQNSTSPWLDFWINLKTGYDLFAETRVPPSIRVCRGRYSYDRLPEFGFVGHESDCVDPQAGGVAERVAEEEPARAAQGVTPAAAPAAAQPSAGVPSVSIPSVVAPSIAPGSVVTTGAVRATSASAVPLLKPAETPRIQVPKRGSQERSRSRDGLSTDGGGPEPLRAGPPPEMGSELVPSPAETKPAARAAEGSAPGCNLSRASCRKWTSVRARAQIERSRVTHTTRHTRAKSSIATLR